MDQITPISYHTEAFVKTEVCCTVEILEVSWAPRVSRVSRALMKMEGKGFGPAT